MYLHTVEIENIRSLKSLNLQFEPERYAGWHVLIGDNGSGKSTVIRAIALALIGPAEAAALRQDWREWIRHGRYAGSVALNIDSDPKIDKATGPGKTVRDYYIPATIHFRGGIPGMTMSAALAAESHGQIDPERYVWGNGPGWFSASFGPFRRFAGGNQDYEKLFYSSPRLARHLSAFGEDVALTECLEWLKGLHVKQLEERPEGRLLDDVKTFVNEGGLLPHGTVLDKVNSDAVWFRDADGSRVLVEQLCDGYRSILSMTFELIRQMTGSYGPQKVFRQIREGTMKITVPGVVLVDEIDAHLHPTWQRRVGRWFRRYFPKIQFIVTTHSPLVCQAADEGSVWRLSTPGSDSDARRVEGVELQRLLYGNVLDAYDTELFGKNVTRSEASKNKMTRLAFLNRRDSRGKLTAAQKRELAELRAMLPTAAGVTEPADGDDH